MPNVNMILMVIFITSLLSACFGTSGEKECGERMSDAEIIEKMKKTYEMDEGLVKFGRFEVVFKRGNYFVNFIIEPRVPGGEFNVVFDCAGDLVSSTPGK
jgi:hypothetical protein